MDADFSFPTTILFGVNRIAELRKRLAACGAARPLVVTDRGLADSAVLKRVTDSAPETSQVFSGVQSNPTEEDVRGAVEAYLGGSCDSVIGVGGGSSLDVAKLIRLSLKCKDWAPDKPLTSEHVGKLAPFIAIPTTAGTGSEVGRSSVITFKGQKRVIFCPSLLADVVILDPALTTGLPANLTAATGADALTHCIESFTSPVFHPLCEGIALEGVRLICDALPRAVKTPTDLDARGKMLIAATMGGIAFQKDLGAAHSLAHPLSAICGLHHGLANALVLPTVVRFNAQRKPGVYARVGAAMNLANPTDADIIASVESLFSTIGITPGLRAHGVAESNLNKLADQAFADGCHRTNPVDVTRDDLYHLYEQAM